MISIMNVVIPSQIPNRQNPIISYLKSKGSFSSPAMELLQPEKRTEANPQTPESSENPSDSDPLCPPQKKTRDLPNLTECHACGFKVDVCNGKKGLRTLYSEWRVVLLCNKCFSSVQSSKICSYCFSDTSPESLRCAQCRHSVHESCFLKYKDAAPWSYACLGSEFSVCVDCWIPKPLAISRARRRRVKSGMIKKKEGRVMLAKGSSRVFGGRQLVRSMEDVVKDANIAVEKKVEAAARAREEAIKKAVVARRAVELANNALSLVENRGVSSLNLPPKIDAVKLVDGSELTIELHPHLNNSPRISKSCCLLNTSYLDTPKRWASGVDSSCKTSISRNASGCDKHELSNDNKQYEDSQKSLCEPSVSIGSLDSDSSTDLNRLCMGRSDMKTCSKEGEHTTEFDVEEIGEDLLKEGEGSCSDRLMTFGGEDSGMELDRKQADSALHGEDRCNGQPDRYFLKYSRRNCSSKPNLDNKPKILYNKIYLGSQDSTVGVPFNCSVELRTISNASCQSFNAHL
ncbi:uncharacterized protein LOC133308009 [Gastrolobium bilobum]|uniref:uncharacterized protein LOC133308009 n=1 Tax=Gastrolobium bilobum TaxID=150636 RepID=UPI002AB32236|nr:uncharacterized protein LOC133308009 [Gastrolobium bilobum]XP_061364582.1 uncharacterized protein LOC133308009 [Gastrolobium bilobum]